MTCYDLLWPSMTFYDYMSFITPWFNTRISLPWSQTNSHWTPRIDPIDSKSSIHVYVYIVHIFLAKYIRIFEILISKELSHYYEFKLNRQWNPIVSLFCRSCLKRYFAHFWLRFDYAYQKRCRSHWIGGKSPHQCET